MQTLGLRALAKARIQETGNRGSPMAIFHLCMKTFSRSAGESAVAAAAYRSGERLEDARLGTISNYKRRSGVLREHALLVLPHQSPNWSRQELWNAAEAAENRKNSVVAREIEVSLPFELDESVRVKLAHDFGRYLSGRYGCAADVQLHEPVKGDNNRNFHSHILLSTRVFGTDGFGAKTRVLDDKQTGPVEVEVIRNEWADRINAALAEHGFEERVDHRSHERRGIQDAPTIHVGKGKRAGKRAAYNTAVQGIDEELKKLLAERAALIAAEAVVEANRLALADKNEPAFRMDSDTAGSVSKLAQAERGAQKIQKKIDLLRRQVDQDVRLTKAGFETSDKVLRARKEVFEKSKKLYSASCEISGDEKPEIKQKLFSLQKPSLQQLWMLKVWAVTVRDEAKQNKKSSSNAFDWTLGLSKSKKREAAKVAEEAERINQLLETIRAVLEFLFGTGSKSADPAVNLSQKQSREERLDQLQRRLARVADLSVGDDSRFSNKPFSFPIQNEAQEDKIRPKIRINNNRPF